MKQSHRIFSIVSVLALVFTTFASSSPVLARPARTAHAASADFVPGEVVVGFTGGQTVNALAQASALAGSVNAQVADMQGNLALLSFAPDADVNSLVSQLQGQAGVAFAEPNFIYSIPEKSMVSSGGSNPMRNYVLRRAPIAAKLKSNHNPANLAARTHGKDLLAIPIANLKAMKKVGAANTIMATYPNDNYLFQGGWDFVGASIVWPNATPSAGICEIDSGVDYLHPDLAGKIVKGRDFVNDDLDPMDDNGHGTHVAGIMVAVKNNGKGIAGVSTGKVVAVKALDAQGNGTNFDIAAAVTYCAMRLDVKVINMSLGGPDDSQALRNAINLAVNTGPVTATLKRKLIVAAAGNGGLDDTGPGEDVPVYPAFYSNNNVNGSAGCAPTCEIYTGADANHPNLTGKVLAVAASGFDNGFSINDNCQATYSNFGSWINVAAPGTDIYSTTPYDKPFYMNSYEDILTRYDFLSGTSMAAPYVAATAARRWGYKPLETNANIATDVEASGGASFAVNNNGTCWDASMTATRFVNVAANLDRGAAFGDVYNAAAGTPLNGATVSVYKYPGTLVGSSVITPFLTVKDPTDIIDPTRVYTFYDPFADVINLPVDYSFSCSFAGKVNKVGYTASPQNAFGFCDDILPGQFTDLGTANIPPKSANFDVVTGWYGFLPDGSDLDSYLWLPATPNGSDSSQPSGFAVGPDADSTFVGYSEGDSTGAMTGFPFARLKREGGAVDDLQMEDTTLSNRKAHNALLANMALPYYPGTYTVGVTDYGQIYDDNGDDCGDNYGSNYDPNYDPTLDPDCLVGGGTGTAGIPVLGNALFPVAVVWKDGLVKTGTYNTVCFNHFWRPLTITSGLSGVVSFTYPDTCDSDGSTVKPY